MSQQTGSRSFLQSLRVAIRVVAEFSKTTLIGGLLVVIPIYLTVLLVLKMLSAVVKIIAPVTAGLPSTLPFRQVVAVVLIVVACLICGAIVRTRPGLWMKTALERSLLEKIPGYALIRGFAGHIAGKADEQAFTVVLAEIEEALVPAFFIEDCDAEHCTIFVPSVPTPAAGTIYIISKERVHRVDVPLTHALRVISKWGAGSRELLEHLRPSSRQ